MVKKKLTVKLRKKPTVKTVKPAKATKKTAKAEKPTKLVKSAKVVKTVKALKAMKREATGHSITPRQKEILRLVARGLTNREIAGQLDISVRTVEVHRFNLMRRLRVRNVAQLIREALLTGLLPKSFASR
jgi:DNA-binding NarL/FixJ family response regulator